MGVDSSFHSLLDVLVVVGRAVHFPLMITAFILGASFRYLIYHTVKRHEWFGREFERRTSRFLTDEMDHKHHDASFYVISVFSSALSTRFSRTASAPAAPSRTS